jgi:hypothetical protein
MICPNAVDRTNRKFADVSETAFSITATEKCDRPDQPVAVSSPLTRNLVGLYCPTTPALQTCTRCNQISASQFIRLRNCKLQLTVLFSLTAHDKYSYEMQAFPNENTVYLICVVWIVVYCLVLRVTGLVFGTTKRTSVKTHTYTSVMQWLLVWYCNVSDSEERWKQNYTYSFKNSFRMYVDWVRLDKQQEEHTRQRLNILNWIRIQNIKTELNHIRKMERDRYVNETLNKIERRNYLVRPTVLRIGELQMFSD